jgi:hypothetical protein
MKFTRDFYIGKDYERIAHIPALGIEVYCGKNPKSGKPTAIAFHGKAQKPDWHFTFQSAEHCAKHIDNYLAGQIRRQQIVAERKTERLNQDRGLVVGDVLRHSWGYDQTNIDYYEVTALIGSTMVEIRKIGSEGFDTAWMQGESVPMKGHYVGKPMRRVAKNGSVKIFDWGSWANKMMPDQNGLYRSSHWTAYA